MKRNLIRNVDGVVIGEVVGQDFRKRVRQSIHFLYEPEGIASDVDALEHAKRLGARRMVVTETETGRVFKAPIERILTEGIRINRGHGPQVVLGIRRWTVDDPRQRELPNV